VETDEDRDLRRAGIAGAIGIAATAVWGVYILVGIAISGYTLGRNALTDILAIVPPLASAAVLGYGAVIALRDVRRDDWLVRLIAIALFLVEGALGVSLFGYGAWAGTTAVRAHVARAVARTDQPSTPADRPTTLIAPAPRAPDVPIRR
jgi:hypothetical protein